MPTLPFLQIDAFADRLYEGNPAAVVFHRDPLPDDVMLAIAAENNLSETAFVQLGGGSPVLPLRWFTPATEVTLCGHATLAAGAAVLDRWRIAMGGPHAAGDPDVARFSTLSGELVVRRDGDRLAMDLPLVPPGDAPLPAEIIEALGVPVVDGCSIRALHHADYWLARVADEATVRAAKPDIRRLGALRSNVIVTAEGDGDLDFVSRFFAPGSGVDEDPVTGSAHCTLAPYWAARLGKNPLDAAQIGPRGGSLQVEVSGDRVILRGRALTVITGEIAVPG